METVGSRTKLPLLVLTSCDGDSDTGSVEDSRSTGQCEMLSEEMDDLRPSQQGQ